LRQEIYTLNFHRNITDISIDTKDSQGSEATRHIAIDYANCDTTPGNPCAVVYAKKTPTAVSLQVRTTGETDEFCIYRFRHVNGSDYYSYMTFDYITCDDPPLEGSPCGQILFTNGDLYNGQPANCPNNSEVIIEKDNNYEEKYFIYRLYDGTHKYFLGINELGTDEILSNHIFLVYYNDIYSLPVDRTRFYNWTIPNQCDMIINFDGINDCWDLLELNPSDLPNWSILMFESTNILYNHANDSSYDLLNVEFDNYLTTGNIDVFGYYPMIQRKFHSYFHEKPPTSSPTLIKEDYEGVQLHINSNTNGELILENILNVGKKRLENEEINKQTGPRMVSWGINQGQCGIDDLKFLYLTNTTGKGVFQLNTKCGLNGSDYLYISTMFNGMKRQTFGITQEDLNLFTVWIKMFGA
jgi:hypothetical protein